MSVEVVLGLLGSVTSIAGFIAAYANYLRTSRETDGGSDGDSEVTAEIAAEILRSLGQQPSEPNIAQLRRELAEAGQESRVGVRRPEPPDNP